MDSSRVMARAPASADARCGSRLWERGLPALGVAAGILLVAGPFLATLIRSLLYWAPDGGVSFALRNFTSLIGDARFSKVAVHRGAFDPMAPWRHWQDLRHAR